MDNDKMVQDFILGRNTARMEESGFLFNQKLDRAWDHLTITAASSAIETILTTGIVNDLYSEFRTPRLRFYFIEDW